MTYKKRGPLVCAANEKDELLRISKSKTAEKRHVQRATIFLMYMGTNPVSAISKAVGLSRESVYACIDKALAFGPIAALNDLAGRGARSEITDEDKAWLLSVACQQPKELGYSNEIWTVSLLAKHIQKVCAEKGHPSLKRAGKSLVHGILDKAGIKPHKISYYLERRDPLFEEKMAQVLAVYKEVELINFQETSNDDQATETRKRATISYDEKPGIQAIKNIAAQLMPVPGSYATVGRDYEYKAPGHAQLTRWYRSAYGKCNPISRRSAQECRICCIFEKSGRKLPR